MVEPVCDRQVVGPMLQDSALQQKWQFYKEKQDAAKDKNRRKCYNQEKKCSSWSDKPCFITRLRVSINKRAQRG